MTMLNKLKKDRMIAMKDGDARTKEILTVFVGDLESDEKRGKEITDGFIVKALKKASDNAKENYKLTGDVKFMDEVSVLEKYLPKQMNEEELSQCIEAIIQDEFEQGRESNIGTVMKSLKEDYDGQFDGKLASQLAKQKL